MTARNNTNNSHRKSITASFSPIYTQLQIDRGTLSNGIPYKAVRDMLKMAVNHSHTHLFDINADCGIESLASYDFKNVDHILLFNTSRNMINYAIHNSEAYKKYYNATNKCVVYNGSLEDGLSTAVNTALTIPLANVVVYLRAINVEG